MMACPKKAGLVYRPRGHLTSRFWSDVIFRLSRLLELLLQRYGEKTCLATSPE